MFNNKKAYEYHCFNLFIIYLTYLGWCCSQNCDKCESFGDMVKSVELVVHDFPMALWDFGLFKRFVVRTHQKIQKWSKSRPIMETSKNNKDKSSKCSKKDHSSARISEKYSGATVFWEQPPKFSFRQKIRIRKKKPGVLRPTKPPQGWNKKLGPSVGFSEKTHHHHQSGRIGRIGWSHDRTGRAETKTCCFFGNAILVISRDGTINPKNRMESNFIPKMKWK